MVDERGAARAYKAYAADDIYLFRAGREPFVGRDAALDFLNEQKLPVKFAKRKSFIEAGDLAYLYSRYVLTDKSGAEKRRNYVQVWKLRGGRWRIAADVFIPMPAEDLIFQDTKRVSENARRRLRPRSKDRALRRSGCRFGEDLPGDHLNVVDLAFRVDHHPQLDHSILEYRMFDFLGGHVSDRSNVDLRLGKAPGRSVRPTISAVDS